jgi:hypothetical protein
MTRASWSETDGEAFEALAEQLISAAGDPTNRYPQGGLTREQRALLVDGFDWDELAGDNLIRRWAEATGRRPDPKSIDPRPPQPGRLQEERRRQPPKSARPGRKRDRSG